MRPELASLFAFMNTKLIFLALKNVIMNYYYYCRKKSWLEQKYWTSIATCILKKMWIDQKIYFLFLIPKQTNTKLFRYTRKMAPSNNFLNSFSLSQFSRLDHLSLFCEVTDTPFLVSVYPKNVFINFLRGYPCLLYANFSSNQFSFFAHQ